MCVAQDARPATNGQDATTPVTQLGRSFVVFAR
jgi:hypothetical protein